ncbi:MAG: M28 family peptidase [Candidatus Omnitrophota bacterium]|nr:M28 family peptidase [Candidatus Omnitrophota bacterium]
MIRILRLVIIGLFAFVVLKTSTFGWRFWGENYMPAGVEKTELTERLRSHVYELAHEIGDRSVFRYEKLREASEYITGQFESFGYRVEFQVYEVSDREVKNIIVTVPGIRHPEEMIVIGAHYDTCFNPGADDNASAVAGLLELARFARGTQFERSVRFVAFVNEEPPFFKTENMGSRVYARSARAEGEKIKAAVILESIGYYSDEPNSQRYPPVFGMFYPNKANFIGVVGNFSSRPLVKKVVKEFRSGTSFPIESVVSFTFITGVDFSDNWSFWKEGYSAVMITDTAFYRNPFYHSNADTHEKLDYESMTEVLKGLQAVLEGLASE